MDELEEANIKVIVGPQKRSRVINDEEKRATAYHEAGHAIVARFLPTQDPVHQLSLIHIWEGALFRFREKWTRSSKTEDVYKRQTLNCLKSTYDKIFNNDIDVYKRQ